MLAAKQYVTRSISGKSEKHTTTISPSSVDITSPPHNIETRQPIDEASKSLVVVKAHDKPAAKPKPASEIWRQAVLPGAHSLPQLPV